MQNGMTAAVQLPVTESSSRGGVYWVTGLSGAGKTTLTTELVSRLIRDGIHVVHVDGDAVRKMLGNDLGYGLDDRVANAYRISRLCQFLEAQGVTVICSTMSLYPEIWNWNRENFQTYRLIYLRVNEGVLRQRDQKGLYSGVENGTCSNVVGVDLPYEEPEEPDLILGNNNSKQREININKLYQLVSEDNYEAR